MHVNLGCKICNFDYFSYSISRVYIRDGLVEHFSGLYGGLEGRKRMPRNERVILTLFERLSFLVIDYGMLIIVSKLKIGFNGYTLKMGNPVH